MIADSSRHNGTCQDQQLSRLLAIGPGGPSTGFGRVFRSVLGHLCSSLEVTHFSPNLQNVPAGRPYPVLPRLLRGDIFGRETLPDLLAALDPDFVLLCHDPPFWSVHRETLLARKKEAGGRPFCAFYCPIEWPDLHPAMIRGMAGLDALVLYTQFGLEVVQKAFEPEAGLMPSVAIIPHGVDTTAFHPLFDGARREARRHLFPGRPELHDAFIILNANRNCPRKRVDKTILGFALFAKRYPNSYLYLHMGVKDSGCDVLALVSQLGIQERVLLTHEKALHPCLDDEQLNLIYNACDVGLNTSTGEGWGLVAFEHAATGAPQIVPDHSACREHWSGRGVLIPTYKGELTPEDIATAIELLFLNPDLRHSLSKSGLAYTQDPCFNWETIANQWLHLFKSWPQRIGRIEGVCV